MKNIAYYLDYLYGLERRGIKIGLEHSFKLMEHLGNPQHSFQTIHVAGTNGKGSTCAHIASILKCAHYRVGLYTSPHLVNFNERIRINGIPISDECIVEFVSSTQKVLEKIEATFFEATTALALWYFDKTNVDVAVIETGLGGRLDSTNIIKPTQTIITQVAIDHSEILGNTIEKIAFEKGGIIKNNTPLLLADALFFWGQKSHYLPVYGCFPEISKKSFITGSPIVDSWNIELNKFKKNKSSFKKKYSYLR